MKTVLLLIIVSLFLPISTEAARNRNISFERSGDKVSLTALFKKKKKSVPKQRVVKTKKHFPRQPKKKSEKKLVRVTFYTPFEDRWGNRVACPNTKRARQGITVAAHSGYPFGTRVQIPELKSFLGDSEYLIQDRGSALEKRTADYRYGNTVDVFDVFVNTTSKMHYLRDKAPDYMEVYFIR